MTTMLSALNVEICDESGMCVRDEVTPRALLCQLNLPRKRASDDNAHTFPLHLQIQPHGSEIKSKALQIAW